MNARLLRALDQARFAATEALAAMEAAERARSPEVEAMRTSEHRFRACVRRLIAAAHDVTAPRDRP